MSGFLRSPLPDLLVCPKCGNAERTTACRFCGISKLKPYEPVVVDVPMIKDPEFESELGCVKVGFRGAVNGRDLRVVAIIGPPDPEVGILWPYPVDVVAVDEAGHPIELTYPEARYLTSTVADQLF